MRRLAALLLTGNAPAGAAPPGVDPVVFRRALAGDVLDVLEDLAGVDTAIVTTPERRADADAVRWPSTRVIEIGAAATGGDVVAAGWDRLAATGYAVAALVAADSPDVPELVLAKAFSALSTAAVAAAPARGGGLVALAAVLPARPWLLGAGVDLDTTDAVERLQALAPRRRDVRATLAWRRLRSPADLGALDRGLEGWEATRALLHSGG
ncbi:MAG: DUF2064 domain-containing protein [Mycobacteriales bacterium]